MQEKMIIKLPVHPKYLGPNIYDYITQKVNKTMVHSCTKDVGYITSVINMKIIDNVMYSSTNSIIFELELDITVVKPTVGLCIDVAVLSVSHCGILGELVDEKNEIHKTKKGSMKVFIPCKNILGMDYNDENCFTGNNKRIKEDDTIKVKLSKIRYEHGKFNCIGIHE